ncbi:MAG: hypothetical protein J6333_10090, partial [Planctomycetes bacterium]|nr:hypothetical protein [Planctomycetota bacterium]
FSPPAGMWFQSGELALPAPLRCGQPAFAARALAAHRADRDDQKLYLWAHLALEEFLRGDDPGAGIMPTTRARANG